MISMKEIEKEIQTTKKLIQKNHDADIKFICEIYEIFEFILDHSNRIFLTQAESMPNGLNRSSICFAALYKGLLGIYNAFDCTVSGRIGLANLSLRQVVEFCIIAKATVCDETNTILCDWIEQKEINLQRRIYNYFCLDKSDVEGFEEMKKFYNSLGAYVHSTRASQQVSFSYDIVKKDAHGLFQIIILIMNLYGHLLFEVYMPDLHHSMSQNVQEYIEKRRKLESLLDKKLADLPEASKRVANFYKMKWMLNLPPLNEARKESLVEYENELRRTKHEHNQSIFDMLDHKPIDKTKKHKAIKNPKPIKQGEYNCVIEIDGELWYYDDDDYWFEEFDKEKFDEDEWGNYAEVYVDEETGKECRKIDYAVLIDGFNLAGGTWQQISMPLDYINSMIALGEYKLIRRGQARGVGRTNRKICTHSRQALCELQR